MIQPPRTKRNIGSKKRNEFDRVPHAKDAKDAKGGGQSLTISRFDAVFGIERILTRFLMDGVVGRASSLRARRAGSREGVRNLLQPHPGARGATTPHHPGLSITAAV